MNDRYAAIRHKVYPLGISYGSVPNFVGYLGDGQAACKMGALIVKSWTGWKCQEHFPGANEFFFVLLPHPSFSPDLARSDFYLFIELKFNLFGHRYERDDDVINAVDAYLEAQDLTFFHQGIEKQEHRWTKCIEVRGDYIEK